MTRFSYFNGKIILIIIIIMQYNTWWYHDCFLVIVTFQYKPLVCPQDGFKDGLRGKHFHAYLYNNPDNLFRYL